MFARSSGFINKLAIFAGVASLTLGLAHSGISDEPVQPSKPAVQSEATEKKKNILQYRAYRPSKAVSGDINFSDHLPAPAVTVPSTPSTSSRRNAELLDREKNWIFLSPDDKKKGDSAEEFLGVEEMTLDGKAKSVVTKFLENKPEKNTKSDSLNQNAWDKDPNEFGFPQAFGLGSEKEKRDGGLVQPNSLQRNFTGARSEGMSLQELWQERNGPRAEKMREEKQLRMNEFQSLFGSHGAAPSTEGFNVLGGQSGFGLQPATASTGGFDLFNRGAPAAPRVTDPRTVAPRIAPAGGVIAPTDINARVFGPTGTPALSPEPKKFEPQPAVLPIPQRRF